MPAALVPMAAWCRHGARLRFSFPKRRHCSEFSTGFISAYAEISSRHDAWHIQMHAHMHGAAAGVRFALFRRCGWKIRSATDSEIPTCTPDIRQKQARPCVAHLIRDIRHEIRFKYTVLQWPWSWHPQRGGKLRALDCTLGYCVYTFKDGAYG